MQIRNIPQEGKMVLSAEQERVRSLIADTVSLLCKNGLHYTKEFSIEGLLGITLDHDEVFLVNIKEIVKSEMCKDDSVDSASASEDNGSAHPSARKRRRKRRKNTTEANQDADSDSDNDASSLHQDGEPRSKNIKQENEDSSDDLVFVKNEPGLGSNNLNPDLPAISGANNDILGNLSQQGQLYATPTSNPLSGASWDLQQSTPNSSLYNTLPPNQQHSGGLSSAASPGGMQQLSQQQIVEHHV